MVRTRGGGTRKRPTASERRRRGKQVRAQPILQDTEPVNEDAEQVVHDSGNSSRAPQARAEMDGLSFPGPILQDTEPVNEDAEQVVHDSDDSSRAPQAQEEIGGSSFPGGPVDASLLKSFSTHVALNIWNGEERAVLKLVNHGKKLRKWVLNDQRLKIRAYVVHSGLVPLLDGTYDSGCSSLVSSFCERWQPETNSFHLPFGETTITLDDVASILHIPVSGELICMDSCDAKEANAMLVELLGVSTEDAQAETSYCRGPSVRLHWLRTQFEAVTDASTEQSIQFAARAYLLHLVGCTLFVDKSAVSVSVSYLALFRDLNVISSYSWGAACLAYLYRELGIASWSGVHQIAGNLTLLQAWIYEHFPTLNPVQNLSYHPSFPRAFRWKLRKYADPVPVLRERNLAGTLKHWMQLLEFLTKELKGKRPLFPPTIEVAPDVKEVLDTFRVAAELGSDSLGAYVISMASNASDVLAVELLQKDARLAVSGDLGRPCPGGMLRVVPLFETVKDLRGAGSVIRKLLSIDWYREHIIKNHNGHQEMLGTSLLHGSALQCPRRCCFCLQ